MAKFAHFENVAPSDIFSLYERHAEASRDIHALAVRKMTGREDVHVDLVRRDPNVPDAATFDAMAQYDVISISSQLTSFGENMNEGLVDAMKEAIERFKGHMPAVVMAVGNDGEEGMRNGVKLTELTRNGVTVGEANSYNGQHMMETHSSYKPNIAAVNPFDTQKFRYIEFAPDLTGHESLVQNFLVGDELRQRSQVQCVDTSGLLQDPKFIQEIERQTAEVMKDPSEFHKKVHGYLKHRFDFDDQGYVTGVDGTSFSAPYQAGSISGALLLEEERAAKNLPSLTVDEVMTIAKLSTEQVSLRESIKAGEPYGMHSYENDAGQIFTTHGGHGVFSMDKFKTLLDEAHKIIETNPEIDRTNVVYNIAGSVSEGTGFSFTVPENENGNLIFEKMLITYETPDVGRSNAVSLEREGGANMMLGNRGRDDYNWLATDRFFGEKVGAGSTWNLEAYTYQRQGEIKDPTLQLYAYREEGLLGQMIAKYGDDPKLQHAPDLKAVFKASSATADESYTFQEQIYLGAKDPALVAAP